MKLLLISYMFLLLFLSCSSDEKSKLIQIQEKYQKEKTSYTYMLNDLFVKGVWNNKPIELTREARNEFKTLIKDIYHNSKIKEEALSDKEKYDNFLITISKAKSYFNSITLSLHSLISDVVWGNVSLFHPDDININFKASVFKSYLDSQTKQLYLYESLTRGLDKKSGYLIDILISLRERAISLYLVSDELGKLTFKEFINSEEAFIKNVAKIELFGNIAMDSFEVMWVLEKTVFVDYLNQAGAVLITNVESQSFNAIYEKEFKKFASKYRSVNYYLDPNIQLIKTTNLFGDTRVKAPAKGKIIYLKNGEQLIAFIMKQLITGSSFKKSLLYNEGLIKKTRKFESSFFGGDKAFDPNLHFSKD